MAAPFEKVCSKVLKRVVPKATERRKVLDLSEGVRCKVVECAAEFGLEAEVRLDGSVAKDTWLSGEADIDIFMRVPTSLSREEMEEKSLTIARNAMEGYRVVERFAEHPYVEAWVNGSRVNIVPCYSVEKGKWLSATDRTPFHTDYMKTKLDEKLRNEVRLLKKFMKGTGIYGAEIKVGGFSGMLCETLTLFYGSFQEIIRAASDWRRRQVIDLEGYYADREDEIHDLFEEPLIVIDPVDGGRNVAAAVSEKRFWEFVSAAREFSMKPGLKFFYPTPLKALRKNELVKIIKQRGSSLVCMQFGEVNAVVDVLWSQLYKTESALKNLFKENDFEVIRSACWTDEKEFNAILFELNNATLPTAKKHLGPPVTKRKESDKFLRKHIGAKDTVSGPWIEKDRWIAEKTRKHADAKILLRQSLVEGGRGVGVAAKIAQSVKKDLRILLNEEIVKLCKTNENLVVFLSEYLVGRPPWLA